jgi:glycosyltransferase involved in cell wall biosynthesis
MLFAVDAHAIGRHLTGNEVYVRNLLGAFAGLDHEAEFVAYVSATDTSGWIPGSFRVRPVSANPFVRLGVDLAAKLRQDAPDLLHVQYTAPLACPVPVVVSVHDVSFLEHPEYFPFLRARQLRYTVRRTVYAARVVLTGSEFSRQAILNAYSGLDESRVVVVPNAAAPAFRPVAKEPAMAYVRKRFGVRGPFVLSVGDLQPRKNQIGLIEGFAHLVATHRGLPHELVLAGKETWFTPKVRAAAARSAAAARIRFCGFVGDDDLLQLYNACDVFAFPSFYEGFGLPVLEAMACGRAVACSNTSALLEVADGAAILFDPYEAGEIARALADLLLDSELRGRMERLGGQRAAQFSWQKTARETLEVYYQVAERSRAAHRVLRSAPVAHG